MSVEKDYLPDLVTGASIRDGLGRIISKTYATKDETIIKGTTADGTVVTVVYGNGEPNHNASEAGTMYIDQSSGNMYIADSTLVFQLISKPDDGGGLKEIYNDGNGFVLDFGE